MPHGLFPSDQCIRGASQCNCIISPCGGCSFDQWLQFYTACHKLYPGDKIEKITALSCKFLLSPCSAIFQVNWNWNVLSQIHKHMHAHAYMSWIYTCICLCAHKYAYVKTRVHGEAPKWSPFLSHIQILMRMWLMRLHLLAHLHIYVCVSYISVTYMYVC